MPNEHAAPGAAGRRPAPVEVPVHALLRDRWSPYCFDPRPVAESDLRAVFEAARWAPSSYNEQPWRYIIAPRADAEAHAKVLACLVEANQAWAKHAPVLALGCHTTVHERNGQPNKAAAHDLGQASAQLSIEAVARGLFVHQMIGIVPEKARELFQVPQGVEILTGLAIGHALDPAKAPPELASRDAARRPRKPHGDFFFTGSWGRPAFGS